MARTRRIERIPKNGQKNFYLIDTNFLANKFIPVEYITKPFERERVQKAQNWWKEIDSQLKAETAFIYIPDLCIAEAFKVLAKKYYVDGYFNKTVDLKKARDALRQFLSAPTKNLQSQNRKILVHDISTSRDIIIAVDRFNEVFLKSNLEASVVDLIVLSTAKYLIDFFHIPKTYLHIVTMDNNLWKGSKKFTDIPTAFNPNTPSELSEKIFI